MVVIMKVGATESQIEAVIDQLNDSGFDVHRSSGSQQTVLGAIGVQPDYDIRHIRLLEGVGDVHRVTEPFKFASRTWKKENSIIRVGEVEIGGDSVTVMAGPCAVESEDQIEKTAAHVAACGATILRGGAFKPRSSPYSFQGMGLPGLELMRAAADRHGLHVVTEVMDVAQLDSVLPLTDIVQVGARNMQNYSLLKSLGKINKPVLLKRGLMATIQEWLMSAEYMMAEGNQDIILCERGIRTFETYTRNTLDLSAVPVVKEKSHLPIVVDPSHGTGIRNKVIPMARAAIAAGADGLLIETHPDPEHAKSDGPQSLYFDQFEELMSQISLIAEAIGRSVGQVQTT